MTDQHPGWDHEQPPTDPQQWAPPSAPTGSATVMQQAPTAPPTWVGAEPAAKYEVDHGPGRRLALLAAILGAAVLMVGAAWFAIQALTASGGAESPEAATDALIAAINDEDFLTMAELLEPGERRAIATPILFEIVPELQRLGILGDDFDSATTDGLELELTDVTYRVDRPADSPDVALVHFTGGTSTLSLDVDRFRFGRQVRQELDRDPSIADELGRPDTGQLSSDTPIVMVERDGRWYVSMVYTLMEDAFPGELPAQVAGLTPVGADSPEAAVEATLQAAADLDLRGLVQRLEPGEMHALHRYSSLFLDDAQRALDEVRASLDQEGVDVSLSNLVLERNDDGDTTIVDVRGFDLELRGDSLGTASISYGPERLAVDVAGADGTVDVEIEVTPTSLLIDGVVEGERVRIEATGSDDRTTWTIDGRVGAETIHGSVEIDEGCWPYTIDTGSVTEGCLLDDLGGDVLDPGELPAEFPGLPMVVAESDGQWYVSPIGSVMHGVVQSLRDLDERDVDDWFDGGDSPGRLGFFGGLGGFGLLGLTDGVDQMADFDQSMDSSDPTDPTETTAQPDQVIVSSTLPVSAGQRVTESGTLGANERHRWTVALADGEVLAVTLDSDGASGIADPMLEVYDDAGLFVGSNDDYEGLNSGLRLVGPGTFELEARDLFGGEGDYRLTVEVAADEDSLVLAPGADVLGTGQFGLGSLSGEVEDIEFVDLTGGPLIAFGSVADGAYDQYVVEATGRSIVIELVPDPDSTLDPYLVVRDGTGTELASNDDDTSGDLPFLSSRIVLDRLTGTLFVEARSLSGLAGDYEIRISEQP